MTCCVTPTTLNIPAGTPANERLAMVQQLIAQCAFINQGCDGGSGGGDPNNPIPPTVTFYFNQYAEGYFTCLDRYGGGTFYYPIRAGSFLSTSTSEANTLAIKRAIALAKQNHFCVNAPCLCPCVGVATTINIKMVGGVAPFRYEITSGTLPAGMTLAFVGGVLKLAGTAATNGSYALTLKIFDHANPFALPTDENGWLVKNLTINVIEITTASPLPNFATGEPYSQQINTAGGVGPYVYSILGGSGDLPEGLTISDSGLISGTPTALEGTTFTVVAVDTGLTNHQGCQKEFTLDPGDVNIIYWRFDDTGALFHGGGTFSQMAPDVSDSPGGHDMIDDSGGIPRIDTGLITQGWQGGYYDASGNVVGQFNHFPQVDVGIGNKFTMRFWFKIDPTIYGDIGFGSVEQMIDSDSCGVWYNSDSFDETFWLYVEFFLQAAPFGLVVETPIPVPVDFDWHRAVVSYDPDTGLGTVQMDDQAPVVQAIAALLPVGSDQRVRFDPDPGGDFDPFPDQPSRFQICEFYLSDVIWTDAQRTFDWNGGAGRTWPNVPGAS